MPAFVGITSSNIYTRAGICVVLFTLPTNGNVTAENTKQIKSGNKSLICNNLGPIKPAIAHENASNADVNPINQPCCCCGINNDNWLINAV